MATETPVNINAKETIAGPAYMAAVGAPSGFKAKTRKYTGRKCHITSRYLRPKIGSCHDRCKHGTRDEPPELKRPGRRLGVRKMWVKKNKLKRTVEPVERKKMTKTKPKPSPRPKICARDEPINRKSTQNELKLPKNHVKPKPSSSSVLNHQKNKKEIKNIKNTGIVSKSASAEQQVASKATHAGLSPRNHKPESPQSMTKSKLKQLLAEKITEITLHEAENEEFEFVPPTVEIIESPLNDEHSMTKTKFKQLVGEKITEMTLHEAENAPNVEIIESPLKDEHSMTQTAMKITEMPLQEAENAELESVPPTVEIESPLKDENSMTKTAEKITETTLHEAENAELESVPLTGEIIKSLPTVTTESSDLPGSESSQSYSDKQVSEGEECENPNNVSEDDYETDTSERKENGGPKVKFMRGRVVKVDEDDDPRKLKIGKGKIPEDNDDGPKWLKFRRGKILEIDEDDGPTRLNFRRGKILEDNEEDETISKINFKKATVEEATDDCKKESETVTLKHQEMQEKKEAQELLNRVIEETASKLEDDRKTKVEALVGAFETVISLHDDTSSSQ